MNTITLNDTETLIGADLDRAVADCLNIPYTEAFTPSTDWAQAGAIIEREHISIMWDRTSWISEAQPPEGMENRTYWLATATTPLVAAMRMLVAAPLLPVHEMDDYDKMPMD